MNNKTTLLLADDDPAVTDSLVPFLERAGFQVLIASDGATALEKAQTLRPDLLLLDVLMPRMDGREVLRHLRRAKDWTPTILLTRVGELSERALALEQARMIISTNLLTRMNCWRASTPFCGAPALAKNRFRWPGCWPVAT